MSPSFEELDFRRTRIGDLSLRRRREPATGADVIEVKLGDHFLMSSLFTEGEVALARLGLDGLPGDRLDVIVGGLGLGHTAAAVLDHPRLGRLVVVEAIDAVIAWHRSHLVPLGRRLDEDARCRLVEDDFFAVVRAPADTLARWGLAGGVDAILVDIDHSPDALLHPEHGALYSRDGLACMRAALRPGGAFALWSDAPPDEALVARLAAGFATARAEVVAFPNPLAGGVASNTVYVARVAG